jgi:hypothetical protein
MVAHRRFLICLLSLTCLLVVSGAPPASGDSVSPENNVPGWIESSARRLANNLTKDGYQVARGYFKLYAPEDCAASYAAVRTCYANNPAAPYVTSVVPPWPGEFVDPGTTNALGLTKAGYRATWRFDPREAIVILAQMPPPAAYFGLQTYLFSRQGTYNTKSKTYKWYAANVPTMLPLVFHTLPSNANRIMTVDSLSNATNNVVIERQSGAAFNQQRYFIITPDRHMDGVVRQELHNIGIADKDIFTEPIPGNMRTGLGEEADEFAAPFIRYSMPADKTASEQWRKDLPLVVLRVRETGTQRQPETYPPVQLEVRTGEDESDLQPDLASLIKAVAAHWDQPCVAADCSDRATQLMPMQPPPMSFVGPLCEAIGMDCMGDTQDTAYWVAARPLPLDTNMVYAVAGTLGTKTGNATYVGLGANDSVYAKGVTNVPDTELDGSANEYATGGADYGKLYVWYFARSCDGLEALTGDHCKAITLDMIPVCDAAHPGCARFSITQRNYIRPGTQRGPDASLVLPPVVISLQRP